MDKSRTVKQKAASLLGQCIAHPKRPMGILLMALGIGLAALSRGAQGTSSFQNFTTGLLMGLSAGILLTGSIMILLSFRR